MKLLGICLPIMPDLPPRHIRNPSSSPSSSPSPASHLQRLLPDYHFCPGPPCGESVTRRPQQRCTTSSSSVFHPEENHPAPRPHMLCHHHSGLTPASSFLFPEHSMQVPTWVHCNGCSLCLESPPQTSVTDFLSLSSICSKAIFPEPWLGRHAACPPWH